jgi:hypothetical protein
MTKTNALLISILVSLSAACASDDTPEPECTEATLYQGATVTCAGGEGVCIARGTGELECVPRCAEDDGPACVDARWFTVAVSDGPPVCYCDASTPWVWEPIIRDHRE